MTNEEIKNLSRRILDRIRYSFFASDFNTLATVIKLMDILNDNLKELLTDDKSTEETFDFYEAIKRVVEGKKVMAHDWPDGDYIALNSLGHAEFFSNEVYSRALIYKDYLKKSWKEVKEQPKTFGWDEAYRLMKEGVKVTRKFYQGKLNPTLYWYIKNGYVVYHNASNCEYYGLVNKKELDATDWYVYEE